MPRYIQELVRLFILFNSSTSKFLSPSSSLAKCGLQCYSNSSASLESHTDTNLFTSALSIKKNLNGSCLIQTNPKAICYGILRDKYLIKISSKNVENWNIKMLKRNVTMNASNRSTSKMQSDRYLVCFVLIKLR